MQDSPIKVSVIIPVYNGEEFLREALESIRNQTLSNFECLCIHDGGRDSSPNIICEFAQKDLRFVAVDRPNKGVAATRNWGMDHARGEYLTFMDQDDTLQEDYLARLVAAADSTRADIVVASIGEDSSQMPESGIYDFVRFMRSVHQEGGVDIDIWGKLYRRSTLGGVRCPNGLFGADDYVFTCRYFHQQARSLRSCPDAIYRYRMHANNITTRMPARYIIGTLEAEVIILALLQFLPDCARTEVSRAAAWGIKKVLRNNYTADERLKISNRIRELLEVPAFAHGRLKDRFRLNLAAFGFWGFLKLLYPSVMWKRRKQEC